MSWPWENFDTTFELRGGDARAMYLRARNFSQHT